MSNDNNAQPAKTTEVHIRIIVSDDENLYSAVMGALTHLPEKIFEESECGDKVSINRISSAQPACGSALVQHIVFPGEEFSVPGELTREDTFSDQAQLEQAVHLAKWAQKLLLPTSTAGKMMVEMEERATADAKKSAA